MILTNLSKTNYEGIQFNAEDNNNKSYIEVIEFLKSKKVIFDYNWGNGKSEFFNIYKNNFMEKPWGVLNKGFCFIIETINDIDSYKIMEIDSFKKVYIEIGDLVIINENFTDNKMYNKYICLIILDGMVSLNNPKCVWANLPLSIIQNWHSKGMISLLPKGYSITLEQQ
jgi:hypothetical protein